MKNIFTIFCLAAGLFLVAAQSVQAHMVYMNPDNPTPEPGETIYLKLGFGHEFPNNQVVKRNQLASIYALDSKGNQITVQEIFPGFYKFTPKSKGIYLIQAQLKPGFVSVTSKGHKLGSKKEHKNAKSCFRYHMNAATLIQTKDTNDQAIQKGNKKDLRLLPLQSPSEIEAGEEVSFLVKFKGKKAKNVNVLATFSGSDKHWVQEEYSNDKGKVTFRLDKDAPWLFQAKHTTPYQKDKEVCDKHTYKSTVTIVP